MHRALLTWSDRGAGPRPAHHATRPASDRGPVMRLLRSSAEGTYESGVILATTAGRAGAEVLADEMREFVADVSIEVLAIRDPSDFSELYRELGRFASHRKQASQDVLLSAGTPQMQTMWLILVTAGLLRARMLQVIPAAFVPSVHPSPVREVHLEIDGFPEIRALRDEVARLRARPRLRATHLIGESEPMQALVNRLLQVAPSDLPVLIRGETGTGKELIARSLHEASLRSRGPLISENCGALTESVLASELFGHERGAFTGASHRKRGLFELAHGGTLFLDEVGELSPAVQVKLLRVLEDGHLRRLGGEESIRVDVRIVAATHRDLPAMIREGTFREDLYYRLHGATLTAPPLRERISDLEALVTHLLGDAAERLRITREAWGHLEAYAWPGNVRELRSEVRRWTVFCDRWVRPEDLDARISARDSSRPSDAAPTENKPRALADYVAAAEREALALALQRSAGNLSQAARDLAIDRNTLKRKLRKYQLRVAPGGTPKTAP